MKKTRGILALFLLLALLFTSPVTVQAIESQHYLWPAFQINPRDEYIAKDFVHFAELEGSFRFDDESCSFVTVTVPAGLADYTLTPVKFTAFYSGKDTGLTLEEAGRRGRVEPVAAGPADYSQIQFWRFYDSKSDRSYLMPVLAVPDISGQTASVDKLAAYTERAEKLLSTMRRFDTLFDTLATSQNAGAVQVGAYHPSDINLACKMANRLQKAFDFTILWPDTHDFWVEGSGWSTATVEDMVTFWTEYKLGGGNSVACPPGALLTQGQVDALDRWLDVIAPYYLDYFERHRIDEPDIEYFAVDGSRGVIDRDRRTVMLRMPAGTDWDSLAAPDIRLTGECVARSFAGSLAGGEILYRVTPGDRATGTYYNGKDTTGYGFQKDLSRTWKVVVEEGLPYTNVISFSVTTADGKIRKAVITEGVGGAHGAIALNLPVGTGLTALRPEVDIAGEGYYYTVGGQRIEAGQPVDFTQPVTLTVYNTRFGTETVYDASVTAHSSPENRILSYRIGEAEGVIDGDAISVTVPYATDLAAAEPVILLSEFASLTAQPEALAEGDNAYTVTAEDGSQRHYTVTIRRAAVSQAKDILSFRYGGYMASIDNATAAVTLTLPRGSSTTFAPVIELSPFATVSPASGEVQDFSRPVKYRVTAQDGSTRTYTVTVTVSGEAVPNEYKSALMQVVNNIIWRYRTQAAQDWEWLDLGLYERLPENYNAGQGHDFNLEEKISNLNTTTSVAMTELDRTVMMLTARGFDCTKLSQYNGGQPFTDKNGNPVDDLVSSIYNYDGGYTINGPAFALLALDMGNYTVPDNAFWTRGKLLETLLAHPYLSDGFGIDMVGGIMYAIGPYQNDPVYGQRVRAKLEEGLGIVLEQMNGDYSFGSWGAVNSESAAWVMMGLCCMGIDCHTDPRFSDGQGHSMLQHWMDNFANVREGYFHHTASLQNNALATYEGCYAAQWYLGFLENGGQGNPYSLYYRLFDFGRKLSQEAEILRFELEGKMGEIVDDTITVTLQTGTPLTDMTPRLTLSEGATLLAPTLPVTFVEGVPQPFTVLAEDGVTQGTYYVTVRYGEVGTSGAELKLDSLRLQNSVLSDEAILDREITVGSDGTTDILLTVKPGVKTDQMHVSADLSHGATSAPPLDGRAAMDLSDWTAFTVTSGDGTQTRTYRIKVVARSQAEITAFSVQAAGTWYFGAIDNSRNTITVTGVDDSRLTSTKLVTEIDFTGKTCSPTSGVTVDFAVPVTYTLSGDSQLASRSYTVTVLNKKGEPITAHSGGTTPATPTAPKITAFAVLGAEGEIDHDAGTVTVRLPEGTNVTAVSPAVTVPAGAAVSPVSGQVVNLRSPVRYTVTLGVESRIYTVTVVFVRSISQQLWDDVAENSNVTDHQVSRGRGIH